MLSQDPELERQWRLGRALHDGLCQELAGISLACEVLRRRAVTGSPPCADDIGRIGDAVLNALADARAIAVALDPIDPRPQGLDFALRNLAEAVAAESRGCVRYTSTGGVSTINRVVANHLYRLAEHALRDAARAGERMDLQIVLSNSARALKLRLVAKGPACSSWADAGERPDWRFIIERITAMGGRVVSGAAGRGAHSTLTCVFPGEMIRFIGA